MKRQLLYSISAILLLTLTVVGSTYAFFSASTNTTDNAISTNGSKFEVIYSGGEHINESIKVVAKKEDGYNTTVNIRVAEGSAKALATLYINIEEISKNLAIEGFVWEVYKNNETTAYSKGNFDNTTSNSTIDIVNDYRLSEENTSFTIYFWIDGNKTDNDVLGGTFSGYIGAKTENFTGNL